MIFESLSSEQMYVFYIFSAVFSLGVGSFLNVVVYRLPIMMSENIEKDYNELKGIDNNISQLFNLSYPSSSCPGCKQPIKPWQNIPVLSFMLLKGKCSSCKTDIGYRYPLIEAVTSLLGLVAAIYFGPTYQFIVALVLTYMLIPLFLIDVDHYLLPDAITLPLLWVGLIASSFNVFTDLESSLFGAATGYCAPLILCWIFMVFTGKEGMGRGDFKLMAAIGAFIGWQSIPSLIFMAAVMLLVWTLIYKANNPDSEQGPVPFGPYLVVSGLMLVYGYDLLKLMGLSV